MARVVSHKYLTRCAASLTRPRGRRAALRLLAIVPTMTRRRALPDAKIHWRIEQRICGTRYYLSRFLERITKDPPMT
jgi:hypothetical protein